MDDPTLKPEPVAPAQDNGERCRKCGYDLTGLAELPRCPKCGELWAESPTLTRGSKRTILALDLAIVGIVIMMLLIPPGEPGMMPMIPRGGLVLRLLLFPVQWILALIVLVLGARLSRLGESDNAVCITVIIPVILVAMTLFFGGAILRFEGLYAWLMG